MTKKNPHSEAAGAPVLNLADETTSLSTSTGANAISRKRLRDDAAGLSLTTLRFKALVHALDDTFDDITTKDTAESEAMDRALSYIALLRDQIELLQATAIIMETTALKLEVAHA